MLAAHSFLLPQSRIHCVNMSETTSHLPVRGTHVVSRAFLFWEQDFQHICAQQSIFTSAGKSLRQEETAAAGQVSAQPPEKLPPALCSVWPFQLLTHTRALGVVRLCILAGEEGGSGSSL